MYTIINYAIKNKGHNARLKEKEQFFSLSSLAWGKFFRCVRAHAHFCALMARKSCAVGVRNAMLRNHVNSLTAYLPWIQITRHFQFDPRKSTVTEKYNQGKLPYIAHPRVKTNKKF